MSVDTKMKSQNCSKRRRIKNQIAMRQNADIFPVTVNKILILQEINGEVTAEKFQRNECNEYEYP